MPADIVAIAKLTWLQLCRSRAPVRHALYALALVAGPQLWLFVKAGQPGAAAAATKSGLLMVNWALSLSTATAVAKLVADDAAGRALPLLLTRPTSVARLLLGRCLGAVAYFVVGFAATVASVSGLALAHKVTWPDEQLLALMAPMLSNAAPACAIIALSLLLAPLTGMVLLIIVASALALLPQVLAVLVGPDTGRWVSEIIYACTPYFGAGNAAVDAESVRHVSLEVASAADQFGYAAVLLFICAWIYERRDVRPRS